MVSNPDQQNQPPNSGDLEIGTMIGRYRITRRIRSGGMGDVYQAEDTELKRTVAIKLLPSISPATDDMRDQFLREAQLAASLNHPNVITIHDFGEHRGQPFFAMEYVEGDSLDALIDRGPIPIDDVIDITGQLCQGLAAAHQSGLTHRDLKPSNILIDSTGRVRILDFGLATMRGPLKTDVTDSRSGTLAYMSPEQLNDEDVGSASDLFSLGVILYEMLTGGRPFTGDYDAALVYSIVNDSPEAPVVGRPEIPSYLNDVTMRLLQKDVSARYGGAGEVESDLERVADATRGSHPVPSGQWRTLVSSLVIVALFLMVAAWFFPWSNSDNLQPGRRMLAVLPFDNLGSTDDDYFADGVVDAISTHLARISSLGVISRTSSREYRDSRKSLQKIGKELGCQLLITGTVHWDKSRTPSRVRVDARLVNVLDDTHLWADGYERDLQDIFKLQSEIARDVALALQLVLRETDRQALLAAPTSDLEAYDFYLRGNQYFNRSWEQDDIEIATAMYQRAVDLDPEFALAYAMLSRGHESIYWEYYDHTEARKQQARDAVDRSLQLQPDLVDGQLALGYYFYHCELDYERALTEFERALDRWPNNSDLHGAIGAVLRRIGPMEKALASFEKASELDPRSHLKAFDIGLTLALLRQYDRAEIYVDKAIALAPDWPIGYVELAWLQIFRGGRIDQARRTLQVGTQRADLARSRYYWWLVRVVEEDLEVALEKTEVGADTAGFYLHRAQINRLLGRTEVERRYADSARTILEAHLRVNPDNARFISQLGLAYTGLRRKDEAIAHARRAVELLPTTRDAFDALFLALNLAEVYVVLEEYDAAIEQLKFLLSIPGFVSSTYLQYDPMWIPLHDHPAWPELVNEADST